MHTCRGSRPLLPCITVNLLTFLFLNIAAVTGFGQEPPPMFRKPTAADLHEMMGNLASPSFSELEKKRMTAVIFVHQDVYRNAVLRGEFPADDPDVKAFLKAKEELQEEVANRMNILYRNRTGENLKAPIIPFPYNNILSDDDVVTGSGRVGQVMEGLYVDALDEIVRERALRPMTAADRARVDVNGLSWDMTNEAALNNFWHKEKYINPQSGFANQSKLSSAGDKVKVLSFDDQGRMVRLDGEEAKKAIAALAVDKPLDIPGINMEKGSGSMSDYMRMAEIHQVKFDGGLSEEDVAHFIRNQKYTDRVVSDFNAIAQSENPELAQRYASFIETSKRIRGQTTIEGVAQVLESEYKVTIRDRNGLVDMNKLALTMKVHQQKQLMQIMPQLTGAVMKNEAYKLIQWVKAEPAGSARRLLMRKQLALTCSSMTDQQLDTISAAIEKMEVDAESRRLIQRAIKEDSAQIRRYAELLEISREDLAKNLKLEGDNLGCVEFVISKNARVSKVLDEVSARPGGSRFAEFLKSKTAKALNLDVMLGDGDGDGNKGEKYLKWSLLIFTATNAYTSASSTEEGLKNVGMAMFETIPFVSTVLRISEMEYKQAFKEFCIEVMPPLALANVAFTVLNYAGETAKDSFKETVWEGLVREALRDFDEKDFEKTETGYYRMKNRQEYLEFLEEVAPGMGRIAKLASMVEPEVEARMSKDPDVKNNNAALHTLRYLEDFDPAQARSRHARQFTLEQIRNRVWEKGMPPAGSASPVERVAAKIILDNLSVRARLYTEVLESFIDRIERRFNELKGVKKDSDPSEIISQTLAILKADYEGAPKEIKESPWGKQRLDEGYRERVAYLKDYSPKDKDTLEIRREMEQIIEDFRKYIRELKLGVSLYEEMQSLNLTTFSYGGEQSQEPTNDVLLGDTFRLGISAKVRPNRANQKWTVFYYLLSEKSGDFRQIKGITLSSGAFNPGAGGLWVIEQPEPKTHVKVERNLLAEEFDQPQTYEIISVFAFGNWTDPMKEVGYNALVSPIDYAQLFSVEKAAFAGATLNLSVVKAELSVKIPRYIYRNEVPKADVFLKVPPYAKEYLTSARFKIAPPSGAEPGLDPRESSMLSVDPQSPTKVRVILAERDPAEGTYVFEATAELPVLPREAQPLPKSAVFDYSKDANPNAPATTEGPNLEELLRQMEGFRSQAEGLLGQIRTILNNVTLEARGLTAKVKGESARLDSVKFAIDGLNELEQAVNRDLQALDQYSRNSYQSAQSCGQARSDAQSHTLRLCELADAVRQTDVVSTLETLMRDVRSENSEVRNYITRFDDSLKQAREQQRQCQEMLARFDAPQKKIDEIKTSLAKLNDTVQSMEDDRGRLEDRAAQMEENVRKLRDVSNAASGVMVKAQATPTNTTKDGERLLRQINQAYQGVSKAEAAAAPLTAQAQQAASEAGSSVAEYRGKLTAIENTFNQKKESVLSARKLQTAADKAKECRASFDAADVFTDSVAKTREQADTCMARAEELFARKTAPDSQVAEADCSGFPGTHPEWDGNVKRVRCVCESSDVWVKARNSCVDRRQYAVETTDCSRFGNAEARWSDASQKALCYCRGNYVLDAGRTKCIDCNAIFQQCQGAFAAGDLGGAHNCGLAAQNCPWAGDFLAQVQQAMIQQQCQALENQILGMASQVPQIPAEEVNAVMDRALEAGCRPSPAVYQALSAAMQRQMIANSQQFQAQQQELERQRQEAQQRRQQRQQAIEDIMRNLIGIMNPPPANPPVYNPPTGGGYQPPGEVLTPRTIVGNWNVNARHPQGAYGNGQIDILQGGTLRYISFVQHNPDGKVIDEGTGSGTWTLNGNAFVMKFDKGAVYKGTVQGDSNAFRMTRDDLPWTLDFTRK